MTNLNAPVPVSPKITAKEAINWVHQTLKLFPQANPPTEEFTAALVSLLCQYSIQTVAQALTPSNGIATKFKYLPTLAEFKKELDDIGAKNFRRLAEAKMIRDQLEERKNYPEYKTKSPYTGPIEEVRPGDILTWERQQEYREFMAKKHGMKNIRLWDFSEIYKDSGARPFAVKIPETEPEEKNPFEDL